MTKTICARNSAPRISSAAETLLVSPITDPGTLSAIILNGLKPKLIDARPGSYNAGVSTGVASIGVQTQFTYLDVGMNFDVNLDELANGVRLRSKVEQLGIAEQTSGVGLQDPIIRQSLLEGTSFLTVGKPLVLGSIDIPGSTRHLNIEVVME